MNDRLSRRTFVQLTAAASGTLIASIRGLVPGSLNRRLLQSSLTSYRNSTVCFFLMTRLGKPFRLTLAETYSVSRLACSSPARSETS